MTIERQPVSLMSFLAGLVSGLGISVVIALYLTHAPVPFVNKVQQATENVTPESIDPNRPLFSPQIPSAQPETANGAAASSNSNQGPNVAPTLGAAPESAAPLTSSSGAAAPPEAASETGTRVMLQVGAFHSPDDADAVRAHLALLGLDGKVFAVTAEGVTLYRVRLGPYGQLDDVAGIRRTLSDNGMDAQLVHVR